MRERAQGQGSCESKKARIYLRRRKYEEYEEEEKEVYKEKGRERKWTTAGAWIVEKTCKDQRGTGQWNAPLMQDTITGVHNRE